MTTIFFLTDLLVKVCMNSLFLNCCFRSSSSFSNCPFLLASFLYFFVTRSFSVESLRNIIPKNSFTTVVKRSGNSNIIGKSFDKNYSHISSCVYQALTFCLTHYLLLNLEKLSLFIKENFQNLPPVAAIPETADNGTCKMNVPAVQWTMTGGQPLKNTFCLRTAANILFKDFLFFFSLALCVIIISVMIAFFRKGTLSSEAGKSVKLHDLQNLGF